MYMRAANESAPDPPPEAPTVGLGEHGIVPLAVQELHLQDRLLDRPRSLQDVGERRGLAGRHDRIQWLCARRRWRERERSEDDSDRELAVSHGVPSSEAPLPF